MVPPDLPDADVSENAREVLKRRYLKKDLDGNVVEEPEDMFWRVAKTIAEVDLDYGRVKGEVLDTARSFYRMMAAGDWVPNSPTLMNAGRPLGQLSACFVLPVEDTMSNGQDGIYDTLRNMALIHQSGGGTGFAFTRLRPQGAIVKSTKGVASGPVSFMSLYDASTNVVKQGGTRRGANMGVLRVDHPDIMDFITCKEDTSKITNFNISVGVTDEFMDAVKTDGVYPLRDPRDGEVVGHLDARKVFAAICEQAWKTGEPGMLFLDEANRHNPVPHLGDYEASNPCGEQFLLPYDVCNLGSLNLGNFVHNGEIQWNRMKTVIHTSMRFLDNVIDANNFPLPEIRDLADRIRRVGNGVMGWADMLVKLGVPYDSEKAREIANNVSYFFWGECLRASEGLAEERDPFPEWDYSVWGPDETCARDENGNRIRPYRRLRNCNVNTVAPTGTISIIAGCSGGIEPLYNVAFWRNQAGTRMLDIHPDLRKELDERFVLEDGWKEDIVAEGTDAEWFPEDLKAVYRTSGDISPADHIRMQAEWQNHTDNAISKTINFPSEATVEDVVKGYELAYELDCKGVTVYRDGSRPDQVLTTEEEGEDDVETDEDTWLRVRNRPASLDGTTRRIQSPIGTMYVTLNRADGQPYEVFINVGKAGGSAHAHSEAIGRLLSTALQNSVSLEELIGQLRGISSERMIGFGDNRVLSGPDAIAQALQQIEGQPVNGGAENHDEFAPACPDCGSPLTFSEGCETCKVCGYSKCG